MFINWKTQYRRCVNSPWIDAWFNANAIKITASFCCFFFNRHRKAYSRIIGKAYILEQLKQSWRKWGGRNRFDIQSSIQLLPSAWSDAGRRGTTQINGIEWKTQKQTHTKCPRDFSQGSKSNSVEEGQTVLSTDNPRTTGHPQRKEQRAKKPQSYTKINSKWIRDLKVKCTITKLKKKKGENLWDLGLGKEFLDLTPKAWSINGKNW